MIKYKNLKRAVIAKKLSWEKVQSQHKSDHLHEQQKKISKYLKFYSRWDFPKLHNIKNLLKIMENITIIQKIWT